MGRLELAMAPVRCSILFAGYTADRSAVSRVRLILNSADREVDLAARAVIKNLERDAWLKQQKDDIKFAKAVSEATLTSTLHAAEAKAPRGIVGAKIKF